MDKPWITPAATRLLSTMLLPTDTGIEWGSGRSTVWFANRLQHLTSVEDNREWYDQVRGRIAAAGLTNVNYLFRPRPAPGMERESEYATVAQAMPDESLSFAMVDGNTSREFCALSVIPKLAPGGLLVIDNANLYLDHPSHSPSSRTGKGPANDAWDKVAKNLRDWRMIWTSSGVTDTAIWIKPASA